MSSKRLSEEGVNVHPHNIYIIDFLLPLLPNSLQLCGVCSELNHHHKGKRCTVPVVWNERDQLTSRKNRPDSEKTVSLPYGEEMGLWDCYKRIIR